MDRQVYIPPTEDSQASVMDQAASTQHAAPVPIVTGPAPVEVRTDLKVYSHTTLAYWWPAWVIGYAMAILTYYRGHQYRIGSDIEWFYASSDLGVVFFLTLILLIVVTSIPIRGLASGLVVLASALLIMSLAYLGLWDDIFAWFGSLKIHMNFGSYFWFSTFMLILWGLSVFVLDRMSCWHITPGQVVHQYAFGAGSKSYDTNGMVIEKHREDLFRHWLLGLGSGDLEIRTSGAASDRIDVSNVFFVGSKIATIQRLIAEDPSS